MRRETKATQNIKRMYARMNLDSIDVVHKAKLLLRVYRDVVWVSVRKAGSVVEEASELYGSRELGVALTYLSDFAPTEQREEFEARVTCLFETQWLIELIDKAMGRVYDYPYNGKLYHEIISKCYVTAFLWSEPDLLDILNLERSVFYERKREAVMLLGVVLWGFAIPEIRRISLENDKRCLNARRTYYTGFVG